MSFYSILASFSYRNLWDKLFSCSVLSPPVLLSLPPSTDCHKLCWKCPLQWFLLIFFILLLASLLAPDWWRGPADHWGSKICDIFKTSTNWAGRSKQWNRKIKEAAVGGTSSAIYGGPYPPVLMLAVCVKVLLPVVFRLPSSSKFPQYK